MEYLGVLINFLEDGKVIFLTVYYLEDVLSECTEYDMNGTVIWTAHKDLLKIEENTKKLNPGDADIFHRIVVYLLFAAKRACPDIQLAVSFLYTRVKCPNVDDIQKLKRCIE